MRFQRAAWIILVYTMMVVTQIGTINAQTLAQLTEEDVRSIQDGSEPNGRGDSSTTVDSNTNVANTLDELMLRAEQGDPIAQLRLAYLYFAGRGLPKNVALAAQWYRQSADQGNPRAQTVLGVLYENGQGVPQDYVQALHWYGQAAPQGFAPALHNLAVLFHMGRGVDQDYRQAAMLYRKAAEQGYDRSQTNLAFLYDRGYGVPQDYNKEIQWLRKAAQKRNAQAFNNLGVLYEGGRGVARNRVAAYALYNLSTQRDPSNNNLALNNRRRLDQSLSSGQLSAGQTLASQMNGSDDALGILDQYLAAPFSFRPDTTSIASASNPNSTSNTGSDSEMDSISTSSPEFRSRPRPRPKSQSEPEQLSASNLDPSSDPPVRKRSTWWRHRVRSF
jgi:TPR repeat protein